MFNSSMNGKFSALSSGGGGRSSNRKREEPPVDNDDDSKSSVSGDEGMKEEEKDKANEDEEDETAVDENGCNGDDGDEDISGEHDGSDSDDDDEDEEGSGEDSSDEDSSSYRPYRPDIMVVKYDDVLPALQDPRIMNKYDINKAVEWMTILLKLEIATPQTLVDEFLKRYNDNDYIDNGNGLYRLDFYRQVLRLTEDPPDVFQYIVRRDATAMLFILLRHGLILRVADRRMESRPLSALINSTVRRGNMIKIHVSGGSDGPLFSTFEENNCGESEQELEKAKGRITRLILYNEYTEALAILEATDQGCWNIPDEISMMDHLRYLHVRNVRNLNTILPKLPTLRNLSVGDYVEAERLPSNVVLPNIQTLVLTNIHTHNGFRHLSILNKQHVPNLSCFEYYWVGDEFFPTGVAATVPESLKTIRLYCYGNRLEQFLFDFVAKIPHKIDDVDLGETCGSNFWLLHDALKRRHLSNVRRLYLMPEDSDVDSDDSTEPPEPCGNPMYDEKFARDSIDGIAKCFDGVFAVEYLPYCRNGLSNEAKAFLSRHLEPLLLSFVGGSLLRIDSSKRSTVKTNQRPLLDKVTRTFTPLSLWPVAFERINRKCLATQIGTILNMKDDCFTMEEKSSITHSAMYHLVREFFTRHNPQSSYTWRSSTRRAQNPETASGSSYAENDDLEDKKLYEGR